MRINDKGKWDFYGLSNPRPISATTHITDVPHSKTLRFSYLVKPGRAAIVCSVSAIMMNTVAPSASANKDIVVEVTKNNNESTEIFHMGASSSVTLAPLPLTMVCRIPLNASDKVEIYTINSDTGGACSMSCSIAVTEGDI